MANEPVQQNNSTPAGAPEVKRERRTFSGGGRPPMGGGDRRGGPRRSQRPDKPKSEFDQKIIDIRRVARVVAGGRRFNFSVAIVLGDHKGSVGVGLGKAGDTALAIEKATRNARRHMIRVPVTKTMSIPYETTAKFASSVVVITPTPGRGVVAGSSVRSIIELAGLKDVGAKLRSGSKNRLNNARVAIEALKKLTPHRRSLVNKRKEAVK